MGKFISSGILFTANHSISMTFQRRVTVQTINFSRPHININTGTVVTLLVTVAFLLTLIFKGSLALSYSNNIRGTEPNTVYSIQRVMLGLPLYSDPEQPPFAIIQKTPLYYLFAGLTAKLFLLSPGEDVAAVYTTSRMLSVMCSVITAWVVFFTSRKLAANKQGSAFAALLAFIVPIPWYSLARPDALMAVCGVSTIALYVTYQKNSRADRMPILLIIAGALGCLSVLAKQSGAVFLIAVGSYALLRLRFRELVALVLGSWIMLAITSLLFSNYYSIIPTDNNFFYKNIIGGVNNGTNLSLAYLKLYSLYFSWHFPLVALPLGALVSQIQSVFSGRSHINDTSYLLGWSFLVITTFNLIAGLKLGSAIHYMNESMIIGILVIVQFIVTEDLSKAMTVNSSFKPFAITAVVLWTLIIPANRVYAYYEHSFIYQAPRTNISVYDRQTFKTLEQEFERYPDTYLYSTSKHLVDYFPSRFIFPQRFITQQNQHRVINLDALPAIIESGQLRYIVIRHDETFPKTLFGYDSSNFELMEANEKFHIYVTTVPENK